MDPVERNRREALMTDAAKIDSEHQPLAEVETIARRSGAVGDAGTAAEDAALPDDQPRAEAETAAAARGALAAEPRPEFEERTETGLLPGEVIGSGPRPTAPYQFLPGDGQAEAQEERIAEFFADQAEADDPAEDDDSKPKAKKAKKGKN